MKIPRYLMTALALVLGVVTAASAGDIVLWGASSGLIIPRDEFDVPGANTGPVVNFGLPIATLNEGFGNLVPVGLGCAACNQADLRDATNLTANVGGSFGAGSPMTGVGIRPDGSAAVYGTANGAVFQQDPANLLAAAANLTPAGQGFNGAAIFTDISDVEVFSNGDLAIAGGGNSTLFIRDQTDVSQTSSLLGGGMEPIFGGGGTQLTDIAISPVTGNVIVALQTGEVIARDPGNIAANVGGVPNFGGGVQQPRALAVNKNGVVAIGLADGTVVYKDELDLNGPNIGTPTNLTNPNLAINAIEATSNGNFAIATDQGWGFVQSGTDPSVGVGNGFINLGLGDPILSVAVVPEPATLALIGLGGLLIAGRRRK